MVNATAHKRLQRVLRIARKRCLPVVFGYVDGDLWGFRLFDGEVTLWVYAGNTSRDVTRLWKYGVTGVSGVTRHFVHHSQLVVWLRGEIKRRASSDLR